jgi:plastocyanin domain-containing protein
MSTSRKLAALISVLSTSVASSALGCGGEPKPPLANDVTMTVTDKGFEPQNLRVEKGKPVKLTITRVSDSTCATEIVIDEEKIKTPLPLNEAVKVSFTPSKTGTLKYGCAMQKMIGGLITIE